MKKNIIKFLTFIGILFLGVIGTLNAQAAEETGGNITVEYWHYDIDGNTVEKIHDDVSLSGNIGDRYHAEAFYVPGYGFSGVNTETNYSPISGLITAEAQTVKLIYHKLNDESTEGLV
ncbi:MucBP domain-containing protein, partial [Enterococcus sp. ALS3]